MKILTLKLFFLSFFTWIIVITFRQWPDEYVHIIFCDVGQGDAILITHGSRQLLIDGGPDEKVLSCLSNNMPYWDRSIDFIVATHMDFDHIGGFPEVLSRYSTKVILKNTSDKKTDGFEALETAVSREKKNGLKEISAYSGDQFSLSDLVSLTVISPQVGDVDQCLNQAIINVGQDSVTETTLSDDNCFNKSIVDSKISENDLSIGIFINIGEVSLLLTGDTEKQGELAVIKSGMTEPVNIIKAGHHGSKSSSTRQFISILRPEVSVISSGENNRYNHPSPQVIDVFNEFEANIYRTDRLGSIKFITDGVKYWRSI